MNEIILTADTFNEQVQNAKLPMVIDFWAPWCGPCRVQGEILAKFAKEHEGRYIVAKVNVDEENELSERYRIASVPTILIAKNGAVVHAAFGIQTEQRLLELLKE